MRAAESAIVFEPIGEHSLKGKTSPVPAWRALRVVAQRGGQGRADALEAPFVGRDEELRQLKELLHAVGRERRARLVSITGPGGIGKSRLVWELEKYIDGVAEDIYWHRGRSPSYGEGITFWALGEMVRRRAQADRGRRRGRPRASASRRPSTSTWPIASERERIGPALLALLGVEDGAGRRARRALPGLAHSSSSASPSAARPCSCSRTSSGPIRACSTSSTTCSTGRAGLPIMVVTPGPTGALRPAARLGRRPPPPDRAGARAADR